MGSSERRHQTKEEGKQDISSFMRRYLLTARDRMRSNLLLMTNRICIRAR